MKVACVGSRVLTNARGDRLAAVGRYLAKNNIIVSGNAEGADEAFATGANEINPSRVYLYLPWPSFRRDRVWSGNTVWKEPTHDDFVGAQEVWKQYREGAYGYPSWMTLAESTQALMARNYAIVVASARVVAAPSFDGAGRPKGGTAFALSIADYLAKPVQIIDFRKPEDPAYDVCRNCLMGRTFYDCGHYYHKLREY